uniref:polyphenol oxidase family protein n=1 Tax=uncultured Proteiniphilum sp. TaxID=497637 RepID=UPI0026335304
MKPHPQYSNLLLFDLFDREKNIVHFTTTRAGGVSDGSFSSFNMGNFSDDSPLNISENREILARMFYMDISQFIIPHQTHGTNVLTVDRNFLSLDYADAIETLYGVDATITGEKDIFLCATTADCVPIILFDRRNEVVAAIHAGWRGTVGRITEKTVLEMERQFGSSPA